MTTYRPDVLPIVYGPPETVQFAVRANCEKLGIDYDKLVCLAYPHFGEILGARPIRATGTTQLYGDKYYTDVGLGNDIAAPMNNRLSLLSGARAWTIIVRAKLIQQPSWGHLFNIPYYANGANTQPFGLLFAKRSTSDQASHYYATSATTSNTIDSAIDFVDADSLNNPTHSYAVIKDYGTGIFYKSGALNRSYAVTDGALYTGANTEYRIMSYSEADSVQRSRSHWFSTVCSAEALTAQQVGVLSESPYILLMPVSRPVYFLPSASVVNLTSPTDDSTNVDQPISFSWGAVSGAYDYNLQVSTSSDFATTEVDITTTSTSHAASGLAASTEHHWRVRYR